MKHVIYTLLLLLTITTSAFAGGSEFDGATSLLQIPSQAAISTTAFTVGCWARYEGSGEGGLGRLMEKDQAFAIRYNSTGVLRLTGLGWSTTDGVWQWPMQAINTWGHVAVSYDASSTANDVIGYLNGVAQTTTRVTAPVGTFAAGALDLYIGSSFDRTWDGQLAECFYYNRVLSPNEVASIACRGVDCGVKAVSLGKIGYWPLGVFGARNYTSTTGLNGTATAITVSTVAGPPIAYASQGEDP